jgi:hypothetical protein
MVGGDFHVQLLITVQGTLLRSKCHTKEIRTGSARRARFLCREQAGPVYPEPRSMHSWHLNLVGVINDPEGVQQPNHHANNHDDIEYILNFAVHRDIGVDQPQQNPDDNQSYDE